MEPHERVPRLCIDALLPRCQSVPIPLREFLKVVDAVKAVKQVMFGVSWGDELRDCDLE